VEFIRLLDREFPDYLAEEWDNVGLQIASDNIAIRRVILTLDVSEDLLKYALENKFNLVISHHPLIFKPIKSIIAFNNFVSSLIHQFLAANIALFVMHTNLDKVFFDRLSKILELENIKPISDEPDSEYSSFGSFGTLNKNIRLKDLLEIIKKRLNLKNLIYVGDLNKEVKTVGSCGGTGTSYITSKLLDKNIDVFITSDLKYHTAQDAQRLGLAVVDAGHYNTEMVLLPELKKKLEVLFENSGIYFEIFDKADATLKFY